MIDIHIPQIPFIILNYFISGFNWTTKCINPQRTWMERLITLHQQNGLDQIKAPLFIQPRFFKYNVSGTQFAESPISNIQKNVMNY